jgi:hypothetical protein
MVLAAVEDGFLEATALEAAQGWKLMAGLMCLAYLTNVISSKLKRSQIAGVKL